MGRHAGEAEGSGPLWVFAVAIGILVFLLGLWAGAANSHAVLRHPAPTVTRTVTKSAPPPPRPAIVPADRCMTAVQLQALAKIRLDAEDLISRTSTSSGAYYDELRALPVRIDQLATSGRC